MTNEELDDDPGRLKYEAEKEEEQEQKLA
ncbi:uncharacterized protein METZ01_LOCUS280194 [marine metagenome]|uniref:Uncharacterized protein n=1 Tax=marine metagenome TaxID=408172 RepID=A0A382KS91_9ZZZZ